MLRHRLPARAAAAALLGAPLLGLAAACTWPPLRAGERAQIAAIAAQPGRWYTFTLLIMLSSFLLVPAVLALMRRSARPARSGPCSPGAWPGSASWSASPTRPAG
jgi:hypothetical protein